MSFWKSIKQLFSKLTTNTSVNEPKLNIVSSISPSALVFDFHIGVEMESKDGDINIRFSELYLTSEEERSKVYIETSPDSTISATVILIVESVRRYILSKGLDTQIQRIIVPGTNSNTDKSKLN